MRWTGSTKTALLAIILPLLAPPVLAQDQEEGGAAGYSAIIDNIDLLIDNYARFLGRKYDLTDEQHEYTMDLLRERSHEFLDSNEDVLRDAIDRMFDVRSGGDMTPEELIEWGGSVKPIYEQAKQIILDGNNDWREILTPEQKEIHDEDVRLMEESFATTEDQISRIVSGEMTVEEFRSPQKNKRRSRASRRTTTPRDTNPKVDGDGGDEPRVSTLPRTGNATDSPETPRQLKRAHRETGPAENAGGAVPSTPESRRPSAKQQEQTDRSRRSNAAKKSSSRNAGKGYESAWDKYVKDFIAKYQLNDEQTQKANTVLEDCKAQALRYLSSRKGQFEQIDKQLETLKKSKDKNKSKSTSELTKKRGELMTPIDHIFEKQLKPRLEKLPTRAQRRAAEAAAKKKPSTARKAGGKKAPPKPKGADD